MLPTVGLFEKSSHLTQEAIALYVDALKLNKTNQLPQELLTHVADCEHCKVQITELYSLLEGQEYSQREGHPYFDKVGQAPSRGSWHVFRIAAVLAVAIGLGAIIYFSLIKGDEAVTTPAQTSKRIEPSNENAGVAKETLKRSEEPSKELYARNFIESPNLEDLVGNEMRSGGIEVISPLNGAVVAHSVAFEWKGEGKGPFVLKVLTNTEKVYASRTISEPHLTLALDLSPGLYYWKLESGGELLYVGKFFVK
jgi:hypothetical protein